MELDIPKTIKEKISTCIEMFNTLCETNGKCEGDHTWVIAGGFAAYVLKKTKTFSDIDVFIFCKSKFQIEIQFENYQVSKIGKNIINFQSAHTPLVQMVQVDFTIEDVTGIDKSSHLEMFSSYLITRFDLPICRVAIRMPIKNLQSNTCAVLDFSAYNHTHKTSLSRVMKYSVRKVENSKPNINLKQLALYSLFMADSKKQQPQAKQGKFKTHLLLLCNIRPQLLIPSFLSFQDHFETKLVIESNIKCFVLSKIYHAMSHPV